MKLNLYNIFESIDARKKFLNNTDKSKEKENIMASSFEESKLGFYLSENYNNGKIIDFSALGKLIYDPEIHNLPDEELLSKQTELLEIFNNFLIKNKLINPENDNIGDDQNYIFCKEGWEWTITYPEHNSFLLDNNYDPVHFSTLFPLILKTKKMFNFGFSIFPSPKDKQKLDRYGKIIEFGLEMPDKVESFQPSTLVDIFKFIIKVNQFIKSSQFAYLIKLSNSLSANSLNNIKFETKCTDITKHENSNITWNLDNTYFLKFIIIVYFLTVFHQQKKYFVINNNYLSTELIKKPLTFSLSDFNEANQVKLWNMLIWNPLITPATQAKTINLLKNGNGGNGIETITDFFNSIFYENNLLPFDSNKVITNPPSIIKTLNKFFGPTKITDKNQIDAKL